jgi:hypothetical protein
LFIHKQKPFASHAAENVQFAAARSTYDNNLSVAV